MTILSELGISAQNSGVGSKEWAKANGEWIDSVNPATGKPIEAQPTAVATQEPGNGTST